MKAHVKDLELKVNDGVYVISLSDGNEVRISVEPGYLLMEDGWKHVSDIKSGDVLWDLDIQGDDIPELIFDLDSVYVPSFSSIKENELKKRILELKEENDRLKKEISSYKMEEKQNTVVSKLKAIEDSCRSALEFELSRRRKI